MNLLFLNNFEIPINKTIEIIDLILSGIFIHKMAKKDLKLKKRML